MAPDINTAAKIASAHGSGTAVAGASAALGLLGPLGEELAVVAVDALFGFADEGAAAVEVDAAGGARAVVVVEDDGLFEDVGVVRFVGDGGVGVIDFEDIAELFQERDVVGELGAAGGSPAADEGLDRFVVHGADRPRWDNAGCCGGSI